MEKVSLENLSRSISFTRIYGLNQNWGDFSKWSCIGEPREQHGLLYIFCDSVCFFTKDPDRALFFQKGDLVYIPKHSEYTVEFFHIQGNPSSILLNFDICDADGNAYSLSDDITRIAEKLPAKLIDSMLAVAHLSTNLAHPTIPVTKAFYEMLDQLVYHLRASRDTEKDPVLPAIFYIDNHVLDNVSVPMLAQMCMLNETAFRKAFKAHTGMTPIQYKMQVKINKAKLLLRSTAELPIEAVADALGFYDNAYFHKVFVKCTGQTPKQYRDSHRS